MTSKPEDIGAGIGEMEKDIEYIHEQLIDICFHMKGGVSWEEAWGLSFVVRERMIKNLNKKLKAMSGDTTEYM